MKSAKLHLKKVIGSQRLTYEEFNTILTQCLNSRPLVAVTSQSLDGLDVLTPSHLLLQRPSQAYPEECITSDPSLHRRWSMTKAMVHQFWRRWSVEYIQQLQLLKKWRKPSSNLKVGDLVLLKEDHICTQQWPMARVTDVHPGSEGLVRTVTIRTATSTYK